MFGQSRIGLKPLAALCRRLAISLGAGVDVRTVWVREATAAQGAPRRHYAGIREAVAGGDTIGDSLDESGDYFPEFFRELVHVGEQSGHLPEVFRQLADHYEHQLKMRRVLLSALAWPMLELSMALSVVGLLIWVMGAVPALEKTGVDLLGFGLSGNRGLVRYLGFLAAVGAVGFAVYQAAQRGLVWVAPLQRFVMKIPRLGRALETMALARLTWAMHVTLNSGMDLKMALKMALRSTHNALYTQQVERVLAAIGRGDEIHEALAGTGVFPLDFLDAVQVGEQSGQLVESMGHLSDRYQDEARMAMGILTILLGLAITAMIAAILIFLIFQVFTNGYLNVLNEATKIR